ncbi:MAG TPA: D-2-hydroxyacid dehydrogenase [Opitutaceae bacterium]|nr:D-2-hydroxyacid dehydrogenase [Opitutaceae bacterium]
MNLTVWTNHGFRPEALALFEEGLAAAGCRLVRSAHSSASVLAAGAADPLLAEADVAFGQPDVAEVMRLPRLRWVALTTAGYARYDRDDLRAALRARGGALTKASDVFADPCAQQVLAAMLALARRLPHQLRNQDGGREWLYLEDRFAASVLTGQSALLLGFGVIGRRLAELLRPFGMRLAAFRRRPAGAEGVTLVDPAGLPAALGAADHVINLLPDSPATTRFVDAARFAQMKAGARFYNIGRGTTVDQDALVAALRSRRLDAAYLDVMDPEPLPPQHPLWREPNCFLTCHVGGGTRDQDDKLVRVFLDNLARFRRGEPLADRIG